LHTTNVLVVTCDKLGAVYKASDVVAAAANCPRHFNVSAMSSAHQEKLKTPQGQ
jgi:hypothetical protein